LDQLTSRVMVSGFARSTPWSEREVFLQQVIFQLLSDASRTLCRVRSEMGGTAEWMAPEHDPAAESRVSTSRRRRSAFGHETQTGEATR